MASSVLLTCTLALLAAANGELCNTKIMGDMTATPHPLGDVAVPGGSYNIHLPDACYQVGVNFQQVGSQVTACTSVGAPLVTLLNLNTANVFSDYGARVSSIIYCSNMQQHPHAQGHNMGGVGVRKPTPIAAQAHSPVGRPYAR